MDFQISPEEKKSIRRYYSRTSLIVIVLILFFNFFNDGMCLLCAGLKGGGFDAESIALGKKAFLSDPVLNAIMSYGFAIIADVAAVIAGIAITGKGLGEKLRPVGFDGKDIFNYTVIGFGISTIGSLVSLVLASVLLTVQRSLSGAGPIDAAKTAQELRGSNPLWLDMLIYAYICILAPILEELVFRGVLLEALRKYGNVFGIVMSAVMFGLFHQRMAQCFFAMTFGLVLAVAAVKTKSLIPSIFMHILNNTFAAILSAGARFVDISSLKGMNTDNFMDPVKLKALFAAIIPLLIYMLFIGLTRSLALIYTFVKGMGHKRSNGVLFIRSEQVAQRTWKIFFTSVPWILVMIFLVIQTIAKPM